MKNNQLKIKFESSDDELNIPNNSKNQERNNNHNSSKLKTSHYYLNLRKLNSNRIEKQNMSKTFIKTNSDNFANFLDYFNLTISKQEKRINTKTNKNNLIIEKNFLNDSIKQDEESEFLNSKIDLLINNKIKNNNQLKSNEIINFNNFKIDLNKIKQVKSNDSIQDYITKFNCLPVPIESFQHIQTYLKHTISQSSLSQHEHKYELIYGKNFYWIVKIKKFYSNLYQLKLVRSCQETQLNNSNSSSNSNNQTELNQSLNESLNENINLNWFFSLNETSYLSCLLLKHLKPIGWSKQNARQAKKPELSLTETCDLKELFEKLDINNDENKNDQVDINLESDLVINNNKNIVKEYYDFLDENDQVFIGKCLSNKSGRILIELIDLNRHISLFYSDSKLRSFGYFKNKIGFEYKNSIDSTNANVLNDLNESNSDDKLIVSQFKKNFLLECLYDNKFYVAVVIDVYEKEYFKIRIDSNDENNNHLLTYFYFTNENNLTNFHELFPCKWSKTNNIRVELPNSWPSDKEFDWDEYINKKNETISSTDSNELFTLTRFNETNTLFNWSRSLDTLKDKFKLGSYLECVLPSHNGLICPAKIEAKLAHLLFLKFFYKNYTHKLFVFTIDSTDIYPLGWAELNNYDIFNKDEFLNENNNLKNNNSVRSNLSLNNSSLSYFKNEDEWCDGIYLNSNRFNCGPYFMKSKLNTLPKVFGPGPIVLVLYKLIQLLINNSEKPTKLAKVLQASRRLQHNNNNNINNNVNGNNNNSINNSSVSFQIQNSNLNNMPACNQVENSKYMKRLRFRIKSKEKYLLKEINICTKKSQLKEYLNHLCIKLKCCTKMLTLNDENELNGPNKCDDYLNENKNIFLNFKCCYLCTVNYYSDPSITQSTIYNFIDKKPKPDLQKHLIIKKPAKNLSSDTEKTTQIKNKLKNLADTVFSPIKTRFTSRRQNSFNNENKTDIKVKNNNNKVKYDTRTRDDSVVIDEPLIKKQRKLNLNKSLEENTTNKNVQIKNTMSQSLSTSSLNINNNNNINNGTIKTSQSTQFDSKINNNLVTSSSLIITTGLNKKPNNNNFFNMSNDTSKLSNGVNCVNLNLTTNPIQWSSGDICKYLLDNKFDSNLIHLIEKHEIDGQSFLMLNLPTIQNYMNLKLGPAIKLAHLVDNLKLIYFQKFQHQQKIQ